MTAPLRVLGVDFLVLAELRWAARCGTVLEMLAVRWIALLVLLTLPTPFVAQTPALDRISRLEVLASVWSKAYLYHPRIATGVIDYNDILLKTIPLVEKTTSDAEFVRVLNEQLLAPLQDVQTSAQLAVPGYCGQSPSGPSEDAAALKLSPTVGLVRIRDSRLEAERVKPFLDRFRAAVDSLGSVERLVVDLRYEVDAEPPAWTSYWLGLFTDKPLDLANYLRRAHESFNEFNSSDNAYRQRWEVNGGDTLMPAKWNGVVRTPILVPTLFVVNRSSYPVLARPLDALQRAGRVAVLWEDSGCAKGPDVESYPGNIRLSLTPYLFIGSEAAPGGRPDRSSATHLSDDRILATAKELLTGLSPRTASFEIPPLRFRRYEASAASLVNREQRLFWMMKMWMAVQYFYPHLQYASIDWTKAWRNWIPRFEAADDAEGFFDLVQQMTAPLNDSHVRLHRPERGASGSQFFPPVQIGRVEGKVIITAVDERANQDVLPGDEVLSVDGRTVQLIEADMRAHISSSTPAALYREWKRQTGGGRGTEIVLALSRNGKIETVKLQRTVAQLQTPSFPVSRLFPGSISYLNPFAVGAIQEFEAEFIKVKDSQGLIIDLRGYPNYPGLREFLTQRMYDHRIKLSVSEHPLIQRHSWGSYVTSIHLDDYIEPIPDEHYAGAVVILINAETQSAPESISLSLTTDHRVTFVGSQTAGTTGGTTYVDLPGGSWLEFTGERAFYPDGRRFQGIGIVPDVQVEPTIEGVITGRDEILEKAVEVLRSRLQSRQ